MKKNNFFLLLVLIIPISILIILIYDGKKKKIDSYAGSITKTDIMTTLRSVGIEGLYTPLDYVSTTEFPFAKMQYEKKDCNQIDFCHVFTFLAQGISPANDRYEIVFNKRIDHVFGLGMQSSVNEATVSDFIDTSFSSGHTNNPSVFPAVAFDADVGRMRTPIFVLPKENVIIAYLQPEVKKLRLTRDGNKTTFVLKKKDEYPEGSNEKLVIVIGDNLIDLYSRYNAFLKQEGFFFKKPSWDVFGLNWEPFNEFTQSITLDKIKNIVTYFKNLGLKLSTLTIGSYYWNSFPKKCVIANNKKIQTDNPAMEILETNSRFKNLDLAIRDWKNQGIKTILGLRTSIHQSQIVNFESKIKQKVSSDTNIFLFPNKPLFYEWCGGFSDNATVLNTKDNNVLFAYYELLKGAYGDFSGIKEDEGLPRDQKVIGPLLYSHLNVNRMVNLRDDFVSPLYKALALKDAIIFGRNDWFGVGTDVQTGQGWVVDPNKANCDIKNDPFCWRKSFTVGMNPNQYSIKYNVDSFITEVMSGYPHVKAAELGFQLPCEDIGTIPEAFEKEFIRSIQLATFMPVHILSCLPSHLSNSEYRDKVFPFYSKLRMRLQQYSYDHAQNWWRTGVPSLMQPLFFRWQNDSFVYNLYTKPTFDLNSFPKNEYMFGNAILIRPLFTDANSVKVYLPAGDWKPFLKIGQYKGGQIIDYQLSNAFDYPVFLKSGEIMVIGDSQNENNLMVYGYLAQQEEKSAIYQYYSDRSNNFSDSSVIKLQLVKENNQVFLVNLNNNKKKLTNSDPGGKGFNIAYLDTVL